MRPVSSLVRSVISDIVRRSFKGKICWDNIREVKPASGESWARVAIKHSSADQMAFADASSGTLWGRAGNVAVQIFVPAGTGMAAFDEIAYPVASAFESYIGCVRFYNTALNEIGIDGIWYQANVTSRFLYEELKYYG